MIPNAWFFKLKDMSSKPPSKPHSLSSKPKKHRLPPPSSPPSSATKAAVSPPNPEPRKSYHFTRELALELPEYPPLSPPRKSKSSSKSSRKNNNSQNVSNPLSPKSTKSTRKNHHQLSLSSSASTTCTCRTSTTTTNDSLSPPQEPEKPNSFDIVIDVSKPYKVKGFDLELPRIVTKPTEPTKPTKVSLNSKDHQKVSTPSRRFSGSSPAGVRLKINSPRIMARKQGQNGNSGRRSVSSCSKRRSISESFAVVKSSRDPQKDFRESMVEMIVQNNLMASKDLEDLLACYLSLNSEDRKSVV